MNLLRENVNSPLHLKDNFNLSMFNPQISYNYIENVTASHESCGDEMVLIPRLPFFGEGTRPAGLI